MTTVHLIFPPVWPTEIPYLSLPALKAYLREQTDATVRTFDLNIALWSELRSEENLSDLWRWARRRLQDLDIRKGTTELAAGLRLSQITRGELDEFLSGVRTGTIPKSVVDANLKLFFREERLGRRFLIGARQWEADYDYHDPFFNAISLSENASSAEQILEVLSSAYQTNPYPDIMPRLYEQATGGEKPDLIGVSITAVNQVIPAFALLRWIKAKYPGCCVLIGGAWGTHLLSKPDDLAPLFSLVNGIVEGDGERPLLEAVRRIQLGDSLEGIAGLFIRNGRGNPAPGGTRCYLSLDELPPPDFGDLPLDRYDYPGLLPLQASRGCSWARCAFCSYVTLDPVYRVRAVNKVASDIEALVRHYPLREIAFTDSLMQPRFFARLSKEIIRRGIQVRWRGFGRFDRLYSRDVLQRMARAGCHYIIWGMESASPRILKAMRKGNTPAIIDRNLRDAADAGIHNRPCLIYGYPSETREDRDTTVAFIRARKDWIHSIAFCRYTALRDTPITDNPGQYGLQIDQVTNKLALEMKQTGIEEEYLNETEQVLRRLWLELERYPRSDPRPYTEYSPEVSYVSEG